MKQILAYDVRRQQDIFCKRAEDLCVHYLFAKVIKILSAISAFKTGGTVDCHYPVSFPESFHTFAGRCNDSGKFMSEDARHGNNGMTAPERLQVRTAGERGFDPDKYFSGGRFRDFYLPQLYSAGFDEDVCQQDQNSSLPPIT
jgi:hypothetical protein